MDSSLKMYETDRVASEAAFAELLEHDLVVERRNQAVLQEVKAAVNSDVFAEILSELDESGQVFDFVITDTAVGEAQDDGASWGATYIDQTRNGGITGDDFAGTVSIPLSNGKYFRFGYSL